MIVLYCKTLTVNDAKADIDNLYKYLRTVLDDILKVSTTTTFYACSQILWNKQLFAQRKNLLFVRVRTNGINTVDHYF